jgi:hypothetical protein
MPHSRNRQEQTAPAARFLTSVVFKSFTLFPTFPLLLPRMSPKNPRGKRLLNARG